VPVCFKKTAPKWSRKVSPLAESWVPSAALRQPSRAPEKPHLSPNSEKSSIISYTYKKHVERYFNYCSPEKPHLNDLNRSLHSPSGWAGGPEKSHLWRFEPLKSDLTNQVQQGV
jgi:hypothetical protein